MLQAALSDLAEPVLVWVLGDPQAAQAEDLKTLLALQPLLRLRRLDPLQDPLLPQERYPVYGMSTGAEDRPRGNRFIGFPSGFSLDAFVDELVALPREGPRTSPLAREVLHGMRRPVLARIFTSPG